MDFKGLEAKISKKYEKNELFATSFSKLNYWPVKINWKYEFKKFGRFNTSIYAGVGTTTFFGRSVAPSVGIIVTRTTTS